MFFNFSKRSTKWSCKASHYGESRRIRKKVQKSLGVKESKGWVGWSGKYSGSTGKVGNRARLWIRVDDRIWSRCIFLNKNIRINCKRRTRYSTYFQVFSIRQVHLPSQQEPNNNPLRTIQPWSKTSINIVQESIWSKNQIKSMIRRHLTEIYNTFQLLVFNSSQVYCQWEPKNPPTSWQPS